MLLHSGIGLVDEVSGRRELRVREDGRSGDPAVQSHRIQGVVEVRPKALAGLHKIPEREGSSGESPASFVTNRGAGNGVAVVVSAWNVDIEFHEEGVPILYGLLENLEDRAHPGTAFLKVVVPHESLPLMGEGNSAAPLPALFRLCWRLRRRRTSSPLRSPPS